MSQESTQKCKKWLKKEDKENVNLPTEFELDSLSHCLLTSEVFCKLLLDPGPLLKDLSALLFCGFWLCRPEEEERENYDYQPSFSSWCSISSYTELLCVFEQLQVTRAQMVQAAHLKTSSS